MAEPHAEILSKLTRLEASMHEFFAEQCKIRQLISHLHHDVAEGFALHVTATRRSTEVKQQSACERAVSSEGIQGEAQFVGADTEEISDSLNLRHGVNVTQAEASSSSWAVGQLSIAKPKTIRQATNESALYFGSLQVRTILENLHKEYSEKSSGTLTNSKTVRAMPISDIVMREIVQSATPRVRLIILPASRTRVTLDSIGAILLAWDLVLTPLQLAWGLNVQNGLLVFSHCITIFWTLDVFFNFRTAHYSKKGEIETRPFLIATKYLRTWFLFDVIIVASDWLYVVAGMLTSTVRLARIAKVAKIIRLIRMFRVLRLSHLDDLIGLIGGVGIPLFESFKVACFILYCAHVFSCAWFMVGNLDSNDTGVRWLDETWARDSPTYLEAPATFQYFSAMQWTLSTILSGSTVILPRNSVEQMICCTIILFGLLFQAYVVSMLSSSAVEHKAKQRKLMLIMSSLSRFCVAQKVSAQVTLAARSQTKDLVTRQANSRTGIKDVDALQIISSKIRLSVLYEIFEPHLSRHDFFFLWSNIDNQTYSRLLNHAMDLIIVREEHDIFMEGEASAHAYLLSFGKAKYLQDRYSSKEEDTLAVGVRQDKWLSEAALWTDWTHVGTLEAVSYECTVCCIGAESLLPIIQSCIVFKGVVGAYAVEYHRCLTSEAPPGVPWPNDLEAHGTDFLQVLPTLPVSVRQSFSFLALDCAVTIGLIGDDTLGVLEEEIQRGKSNLFLTKVASQTVLRRLVSVVRIAVRKDDHVFAQLGIWDDGKLVPQCLLPGKKRKGIENIEASLASTVNRIESRIGEIEFIGIDFTDEYAKSHKTNIPTHYSALTAHYVMRSQSTDISTCVSHVTSASLPTYPVSKGDSQPRRFRRSALMKPFQTYLEQKLRISSNLIIVQTKINEAVLCMWLTAAEMQFLQSPEGIDMLISLSNRGELVPQAAHDVDPLPSNIIPVRDGTSSDGSRADRIISLKPL